MPTIATWGDLLGQRNGDLDTYGDPLADVRVGEALSKRSVVWDGPGVKVDWEAAKPPLVSPAYFRDPFGRDIPQAGGWGQLAPLQPSWSHPLWPETFGVNSKAVTTTIVDALDRTASAWWGDIPNSPLSWLQGANTGGPLNSTFDTGTQFWTAGNGAAKALAVDIVHTGHFSVKITPDGVTANPKLESDEFQVVAGVTYSLEGWGALATGSTSASRILEVEWRNGSHVLISVNNITRTLATPGTWVPFDTTDFVAPVGALFGVVRCYGSGVVNSAWHMDEVLLYPRKNDFTASGGVSRIACSSNNEFDSMTLPINMANADIYIDTGLTSIVTPSGGALRTWFDFRHKDPWNTYRLQLKYNTDGTTDFTLQYLSGSAGPDNPLTLPIKSGFSTSADLTIHIQFLGSIIRVKWYPWDTPEPNAWNLQITDKTISGNGNFRIACKADPSNTNTNPSFSFRKFTATETLPAGAYCNNHAPQFIVPALLGIKPVSDFDIKAKVCSDALAIGSTLSPYALARVVDFNNYVRARIDFNTDQVLGWGIEAFTGGSGGTLSSGLVRDNSDEGIHEPLVFYWIRFRGEGQNLMVKIWRDGNPEPLTWNGTAVTTQLTPGVVGFHSRILNLNASLPVRFTVPSFVVNGVDVMDVGSLSVTQSLDDGLPSDVTNTQSLALTQLDADLLAPVTWPKSPAAYWSQFRTDAPLAVYPRDVAPMTVDTNIVAKDGLRPTRIFTGQMADMPADGTAVKVQATSSTLRKLQKLVQPPPIWGEERGLTGTWPVSWSLAQCGVYASPPPRAGCIYWAPMHGSLYPFINADEPNDEFHQSVRRRSLVTATSQLRPTFVPGPFVSGAYAHVDSQQWIRTDNNFIAFRYGTDVLSQRGNTCRLEFWIRTDKDLDLSNPPGTPFFGTWLTWLDLQGPSGMRITMGVDTLFRPFIDVNDGFNHQIFPGNQKLPQDGAWHFVGLAYTFSSSKIWMKVDDFPTYSLVPTQAFFSNNLPAKDDWTTGSGPQFSSYAPVAEVQVTGGVGSRPDGLSAGDTRWINDRNYWEPVDAGATIRPSVNVNPGALVEMQPRRAIELISEWAQGELAQTGFDAADRFLYLPMPYWVEPAQQAQVETITTEDNLAELNVRNDVTRVRNSVAVQYNLTRVDNNAYDQLVGSQYTAALPQGTTTLTFSLEKPAVYVSQTVQLLQPADFTALPPIACWVSLNDAPDGSGGSYATSSDVEAKVIFYNAGTVVFQFRTLTGKQWYFANNGNVPTIAAQGIPVSVSQTTEQARDPISINARGELGMVATLPAVQDPAWARYMAAELTARLSTPRWRAEGVRVFGDPRRRPGQLVRLTDRDGSALDGLGRIQSVFHNIDGPRYEQTLTIVQAGLVAVWDQSRWNDGSVWGL